MEVALWFGAGVVVGILVSAAIVKVIGENFSPFR